MKICCPKCNAAIGIGRHSRFGMFRCPKCNNYFFGLDADVSWGSPFFGDHLTTPCPHCWQTIRLGYDSQHGGYYGPAACSGCGNQLPQKTGPNRPKVYKTDYEEIVDLATGASMSREQAAGILHHVKTNSDLFLTEWQKAEIEGLLNLAVAKYERGNPAN
jgi:hypothetical protein